MGQQQLLLVILVTIIVGIATVVAINIFGTAAEQANRDAVRQDLLGAAVQAQGIWARPLLMDGAGRDFSVLSEADLLERLNIPADANYDAGTDTELNNENGTYSVEIDDADQITITGTPSGDTDDIVVVVDRDATTGNWEVTVDGVSGTPPTTP